MDYTAHAHTRMAERGVTEADVDAALARAFGDPEPGNRPNTMCIRGYARGRLLKVIVDAADQTRVVSVMWES